jgi:hypothetical protein
MTILIVRRHKQRLAAKEPNTTPTTNSEDNILCIVERKFGLNKRCSRFSVERLGRHELRRIPGTSSETCTRNKDNDYQ